MPSAHLEVSRYIKERGRIIVIANLSRQSRGRQRIDVIGSNGAEHLLGDLEVFVGRVPVDVQQHIHVGSLADPQVVGPKYELVDDSG